MIRGLVWQRREAPKKTDSSTSKGDVSHRGSEPRSLRLSRNAWLMVMRLRQETNDYAHPHPPIFSNSKLGSGKLLKNFGTKNAITYATTFETKPGVSPRVYHPQQTRQWRKDRILLRSTHACHGHNVALVAMAEPLRNRAYFSISIPLDCAYFARDSEVHFYLHEPILDCQYFALASRLDIRFPYFDPRNRAYARKLLL